MQKKFGMHEGLTALRKLLSSYEYEHNDSRDGNYERRWTMDDCPKIRAAAYAIYPFVTAQYPM
jgi:hypothetical protein